MPDKDYLYTVEETATILKVNKHTVYALIKKGHLKAMKLGRIKVIKSELLRFIDDYNGKDLTDMDNVTELKL